MDKGSILRGVGIALLLLGGVIAIVNYAALEDASVLAIGHLFNIFFIAGPIGLIGLVLLLIGRSKGKNDTGSDYAKKKRNIRPLM